MEPSVQDVTDSVRMSLKRAGDVQTSLKSIRRGGITSAVNH